MGFEPRVCGRSVRCLSRRLPVSRSAAGARITLAVHNARCLRSYSRISLGAAGATSQEVAGLRAEAALRHKWQRRRPPRRLRRAPAGRCRVPLRTDAATQGRYPRSALLTMRCTQDARRSSARDRARRCCGAAVLRCSAGRSAGPEQPAGHLCVLVDPVGGRCAVIPVADDQVIPDPTDQEDR
jgi:hypothetical protein